MAKAESKKEYRALTGINYKPKGDKDAEEVRVEPGDKFSDMADNALRHELAAGNAEEWVSGETDRVRKEEDVESDVHIVRSRHSEGEIVLKDVSTSG